jgi:hypothetical protein
VQVLKAPLVASDHPNRTQYFRATFPTFWEGEQVEYMPILSCAGRRAPDPSTASGFASSFRLEGTPTVLRGRDQGARAEARPAFAARLEHLVYARVPLVREPEIIGQTPAGYIVNWPPTSGTLEGPAFRATVIPGGEHQTVVRSDGIGIVSASVTAKTHDGGLIDIHHAGIVDYSEDWAERLRLGRWPPSLPVRTHIRLLTADPRYAWLNRLACFSVGEVRPAEPLFHYDLYALR